MKTTWRPTRRLVADLALYGRAYNLLAAIVCERSQPYISHYLIAHCIDDDPDPSSFNRTVSVYINNTSMNAYLGRRTWVTRAKTAAKIDKWNGSIELNLFAAGFSHDVLLQIQQYCLLAKSWPRTKKTGIV
jgi:hypothetical protein